MPNCSVARITCHHFRGTMSAHRKYSKGQWSTMPCKTQLTFSFYVTITIAERRDSSFVIHFSCSQCVRHYVSAMVLSSFAKSTSVSLTNLILSGVASFFLRTTIVWKQLLSLDLVEKLSIGISNCFMRAFIFFFLSSYSIECREGVVCINLATVNLLFFAS